MDELVGTSNKLDKMTIKKAHAVELWRETRGHISNICRTIGISRTTFYEWLKEAEFAQQIVESEGELNDDIRDALIQKAADGDIAAIIFYLKKKHPDFLEKPSMMQQINVGDSGNAITFVNFAHESEGK